MDEPTRSRDLIVLDGATFFFSDARGDAGTADAHRYFYDAFAISPSGSCASTATSCSG